ncbi:MAG: pyridoxal phosphate-dependent aminotransferase [Clostridia bacterium]
MINNEMYKLGSKRSVIRELFEFGKARALEVGADNVYDYSLGNPNVPAPDCVKQAILDILDEKDNTAVHGYTSAQGDAPVRQAIANNIQRRFGTTVSKDNIYMTCGASASLCITLKALCNQGDEVILFAPFFPEYPVFVNASNAVPVIVPYGSDNFKIDFDAFEKAITPKTKAVLFNSPNNPSGVVYGEDAIIQLTNILKAKCHQFGTTIYLIADEPYRELVYDDVFVPYVMNYYANSIICYSYSKSLSLPGERIGYIAVAPSTEDASDVYAAICGAGRALGYVCAPSLFQKVIEKCVDAMPNIDEYRRNRDVLYNALTDIGYECVRPNGAFYLFVKSLEDNAFEFSKKAMSLDLMIVPGDAFHAKGYVRLAYCVSNQTIVNSIPAFKKLYEMYQN